MKVLMDALDVYKCRGVQISFDIEERSEGNATITMVCAQRRKDGTYEIFHQDQFSTPE